MKALPQNVREKVGLLEKTHGTSVKLLIKRSVLNLSYADSSVEVVTLGTRSEQPHCPKEVNGECQVIL